MSNEREAAKKCIWSFVLAQVINKIVCLFRTLRTALGVGSLPIAHWQLLRMPEIGFNFDLTWTCYSISRNAIVVTAYTHSVCRVFGLPITKDVLAGCVLCARVLQCWPFCLCDLNTFDNRPWGFCYFTCEIGFKMIAANSTYVWQMALRLTYFMHHILRLIALWWAFLHSFHSNRLRLCDSNWIS